MGTEYKGSIDIEIAGKPFTLTGDIGPVIAVGWRDGDVQLGTIEEVIMGVAQALVGTDAKDGFKREWDKVMNELKNVPGLGDIMNWLLVKLTIYVTDLYIKAVRDDTTQSFTVAEAAFGFRGDFKGQPNPPTLGPVSLIGFGVLFEYSKDAAGTTQGRASTTAMPAKRPGRARLRA